MRITMTLAISALLGSALPAAAQDFVATQVLQRVCFAAIAGPAHEGSTWAAVEGNAGALNLTLVAKTRDDIKERWNYSLRQPAGVYDITISSSLGGVTCDIDPPSGVTVDQLERSVTQSIGQEWTRSSGFYGPEWRKPTAFGGFIKLQVHDSPSYRFIRLYASH